MFLSIKVCVWSLFNLNWDQADYWLLEIRLIQIWIVSEVLLGLPLSCQLYVNSVSCSFTKITDPEMMGHLVYEQMVFESSQLKFAFNP